MRAGPSRTSGLDRMIANVETGHFERALSALTAAGALVTAAEIFFEHDSASFGNKMMWLPVVLGPVGAAAGVAGFFSRPAHVLGDGLDAQRVPAGHDRAQGPSMTVLAAPEA